MVGSRPIVCWVSRSRGPYHLFAEAVPEVGCECEAYDVAPYVSMYLGSFDDLGEQVATALSKS